MTKLVALAALAILALGGGAAVGGTNATGLRGYVKRGPTICNSGFNSLSFIWLLSPSLIKSFPHPDHKRF
jgi:hypothetical protein